MPDERENRTGVEIKISDLYPDLSPVEQEEAEHHLLQYFVVVQRIFERLAKEKPEVLTELERLAMLRADGKGKPERQ